MRRKGDKPGCLTSAFAVIDDFAEAFGSIPEIAAGFLVVLSLPFVLGYYMLFGEDLKPREQVEAQEQPSLNELAADVVQTTGKHLAIGAIEGAKDQAAKAIDSIRAKVREHD